MTPKNRSCSLFTSCCPFILIFISSGDLLVNIIYLVLHTLSLRPLFLTHVCTVFKTLFARKFSSVMDNTEGGLQESTDLIAHYSSYAGLKVNAKKTQCMVVSKCAF